MFFFFFCFFIFFFSMFFFSLFNFFLSFFFLFWKLICKYHHLVCVVGDWGEGGYGGALNQSAEGLEGCQQ